MKKIQDILTVDEAVKFLIYPNLVKNLKSNLTDLTVKQLVEVSNILGSSPGELLKRVINEIE